MTCHTVRQSTGSCQLNPQRDPISELSRRTAIRTSPPPCERSHRRPGRPSFGTCVRVTSCGPQQSSEQTRARAAGGALGPPQRPRGCGAHAPPRRVQGQGPSRVKSAMGGGWTLRGVGNAASQTWASPSEEPAAARPPASAAPRSRRRGGEGRGRGSGHWFWEPGPSGGPFNPPTPPDTSFCSRLSPAFPTGSLPKRPDGGWSGGGGAASQ